MAVLQGSFHQGDELFPPFTRGRQCLPNCLLFIAKSLLNPFSQKWTPDDVDNILLLGDSLCCHICARFPDLNSNILLLPTDLPKYFGFDDVYFSFKVVCTLFGTLINTSNSEHALVGVSLETAIQIAFQLEKSSQCIAIFCSSAVAICHYLDRFVVFDPHSRSSSGLCCADGKAGCLVFPSVEMLCNHLRALARSLSDRPLFEVQFDLHACLLRKVLKTTFEKNRKKEPSCILLPKVSDVTVTQGNVGCKRDWRDYDSLTYQKQVCLESTSVLPNSSNKHQKLTQTLETSESHHKQRFHGTSASWEKLMSTFHRTVEIL